MCSIFTRPPASNTASFRIVAFTYIRADAARANVRHGGAIPTDNDPLGGVPETATGAPGATLPGWRPLERQVRTRAEALRADGRSRRSSSPEGSWE